MALGLCMQFKDLSTRRNIEQTPTHLFDFVANLTYLSTKRLGTLGNPCTRKHGQFLIISYRFKSRIYWV
jgi:hypothetical protein